MPLLPVLPESPELHVLPTHALTFADVGSVTAALHSLTSTQSDDENMNRRLSEKVGPSCNAFINNLGKQMISQSDMRSSLVQTTDHIGEFSLTVRFVLAKLFEAKLKPVHD